MILYFEILVHAGACMCCLCCSVFVLVANERWSEDDCVIPLDSVFIPT